jgi:uncharacterized protein (DUF697 family)
MARPIGISLLRKLVRELNAPLHDPGPLVVGGARELAAVLRRQLARDARPGAVRQDDAPEGAALLVYVLGGEPTEEDEKAIRRARKSRVPIVAVVAGPAPDDLSIPFVLATDIVRVGAGEGFPIDAIARTAARLLGDEAAPLASRLPVLRGPVSEQIVRSFSRKNAVIAAVVFVPGADLPALSVNQIRMLTRLGKVHGREGGNELIREAAVTVGAGLGFRALARSLLDFVPVGGWAVKSAVAYSGTRALGEAAVWRLADDVELERTPGGDVDGP